MENNNPAPASTRNPHGLQSPSLRKEMHPGNGVNHASEQFFARH